MKRTPVLCFLGWLLGMLLCLSAQAQTTENCSNGIDDDGDNLIDCQDPDCPECNRVINCVEPNTYYMPPIYGVPGQTTVYGSQDLVLSTNAAVATVTIRTPDNSYSRTVVVTATGSTIVSLTTTVVMSTSVNTPQLNKGLIIQSDEPVQATYRLTASNNQDIIPLKGRAALGFSFYAASQTRLKAVNNTFDERHFVSVMATEPNTVVTFRSPIALEGVTAALNTPFSVTLSDGQTYMLSSKVISPTATENKSVAGILITSNQPIAVNSGSQHTEQPYSSNRDAGMDQLVPARLTGQQYVAVHGQNTTANSDYVIVVAIENSTSLTITGPGTTTGTPTSLTTATLSAGQVFTYNLPTALNRAFVIATSRQAYAFHVSSYAVNEFGMGILPTINPCTGSQRIDFYKTSSGSLDQAIVTIPTAGLSSLRFRGQAYTTYGTVKDNLTISGVDYSTVSFLNASIAAAGVVNVITSSARFHVGVVSNTGGSLTGNFGYYSAYDARVEALNPTTNQPDNFYRAAEVTPGQAIQHCLQLTSCGSTNSIRAVVGGTRTGSVAVTSGTCLSYTMRADAPACSRDTIRVALQNETGREGTVCIEFVNSSNDLTVSLLPTSPFVCRPSGSTSLTAVASSSRGNYTYQWITPDKLLLTTPVISSTASGQFRLSVTDAGGCQDTTSVSVVADTPALSFDSGPTTLCTGTGTTATYSITSTSGTYAWAVLGGTLVSGGTPTSTTASVQWSASGSVQVRVSSPNGCTLTTARSVTVTATPTLSLTSVSPTCNNGTNGSVDLTVAGGLTPYSYTWSNGITTQDLTNVPAGSYSAVVRTAGNCTANSIVATVLNPPLPLCPPLTVRRL